MGGLMIVQIGPGYSRQHIQVLAWALHVSKLLSRTAVASGHAAVPPSSVMKWRRLRAGMGSPTACSRVLPKPSTAGPAGPLGNPESVVSP